MLVKLIRSVVAGSNTKYLKKKGYKSDVPFLFFAIIVFLEKRAATRSSNRHVNSLNGVGLGKYICQAMKKLGFSQDDPENRTKLFESATDLCWQEYCGIIDRNNKEAMAKLIQTLKNFLKFPAKGRDDDGD